MPKLRTLLAASLLAAAFTPTGCDKRKREDTMPPLVVTPTAAGDGTQTTVARTPVPDEQKVQVLAGVTNLGDVFAAVKKIGESWMPGSAVDPAADLQAMLLATGFGPGFFGNIDLEGQHGIFVATPPGQGAPEDMSFAATVAVLDARKLIESTPQEYRPQPLGEGMWELNRDGERLLLKEAGKELLLGRSTEDVDKASRLKGQLKADHTFHARATNIPTDQLDPVELLGLPKDSPLVKSLAAVLQELKAVEVQGDLGAAKDFTLVASADAPFHKLGLDPLGKARAAATPLESRLPANPVFVTTYSWGDPKLVHSMIDKLVPLGQIPDPFRDMAAKALENTHAILGQIANDVVLAMYVDAKGRATLVFAADVKDDAATREGLRGVNQLLVEGMKLQQMAAGKATDQKFEVTQKNDGLKVGKIKGDVLTITVPKAFEEDVASMAAFLQKNKLDTVSVVAEGTAIWAVGAGAKPVATDIAKALGKSRKSSLAGHEGLALVRKTMGGCQICVAGDPTSYFELRLAMLRDGAENKDVAKQARTQLASLGKIDPLGMPGAGVKVVADAASFGVVVPKSIVFAPPSSTEALRSAADFVSDPETWLADNGASAGKPAATEKKAPAEKKKPAEKKAPAEKKKPAEKKAPVEKE